MITKALKTRARAERAIYARIYTEMDKESEKYKVGEPARVVIDTILDHIEAEIDMLEEDNEIERLDTFA